MKLLITGGTGTFGQALAEKLLKTTEDESIIFSRDEYKQHLMREKFQSNRLKFVIGDIRNIASIDSCMAGVDYVFHAAAMKHVRICEENPQEAILTNVIGTENVLKSATKHNVKKVVVLSTDKAVCPQSTLGLTKSLAEKIALDYVSKYETKIFITRFGNLMLSRGSVLEKFIELAKRGETLTVTSPKMERFMMTIEDAVDLILKVFSTNLSGRIFIKKSKVYNILTIAQAINDLYENKAPITFTSALKGEKETELLLCNEMVIEHEDFYEIDTDKKTGQLMSVSSENFVKENFEDTKADLRKLLQI